MKASASGQGGDGSSGHPPPVTPESLAEASLWVARLHGPRRNRQMELDFLEWQNSSAVNRAAFERCTDMWDLVPSLPTAKAHALVQRPAQAGVMRRRHLARWAAAACVAGIAVASAWLLQPSQGGDAYATEVGEQRQLVLEDGTHLWINTHSRVRVRMEPAARTVAVEQGEALFEVAHDAQRPFVVRVAASEVVALGTVFSVRLVEGATPRQASLAVALLEGQVVVRATPGDDDEGLAPAAPIVMKPGERMRLVAGASPAAATPQVDRPPLDQLMAWRRSEAVFEDVSLAHAVAEMNRYSRTPIVLMGGEAMRHKRISGMFRTGDNTAFAKAAAALHGLEVRHTPGRLELHAGGQGKH